jgi:hypothetical protein
MTTVTGTQGDLFAWAKDLERENTRIAEINAERVRNRGYLVFATDPSKGVDSAEYQQVYATEARTPNQAIANPIRNPRRRRPKRPVAPLALPAAPELAGQRPLAAVARNAARPWKELATCPSAP